MTGIGARLANMPVGRNWSSNSANLPDKVSQAERAGRFDSYPPGLFFHSIPPSGSWGRVVGFGPGSSLRAGKA